MTSLMTPSDRQVVPDDKTLTASFVRRFYDDGSRDIRNHQLRYAENCAYVEGDQWVYRHNTRNEILRLPRDPRKVRVTVPRIGPESRRIMSKLLKRPLVFEVTPDAPDDETMRGARTAEGVIRDVARVQKWERLREQVSWGAWKGGTAALCLDWDASAGRYLGKTISGRDMGSGDVCVTALTITEIATEQGTKDIERAYRWVKAQALPPSEVKRLYGLKIEPQPNTSAASTPLQMGVHRDSVGVVPNLALVLTYYERPNADRPAGAVAVVVGEQIVDGPHPWPFPFKDRLNLVCVRETVIEGAWVGHTVVSDAVPVQTALNAAWTSTLEHLKQAGNARIQGEEASQDLLENLSDEAAEVIFYRDKPWQWMAPPPMPEWWMRTPGELAAAMDDILGVHDISRGSAPANIQSGAGLALLAEQDDTPTGRFAQIIADGFSDLASMVLQTYELKVGPDETRKASVHVPGYVSEKFNWNGKSFAGQTIARVPYDAVAPINEAARFSRLQFLVASKLITTARQASTYLDIPGLGGDFITAIDPNVTKARRENYQLANGEPCVPATFDDHAVHIDEHNAFRLSGQYERLDDKTRRIVDLHVQAHSTLAAEEAGKQALKMQMAPPLAMAANADQPPGSMMPQNQGQAPDGAMANPGLMAPQLGAQSPAPSEPFDQGGMPS